jgi:hypothetical protein
VDAPAVTRRLNKDVGVIKEAECPRCHSVLRRYPQATWFDKYFKLSRKTRIQARVYEKDILQINDPLFDMYYPELGRRKNQELKTKEIEAWKKQKR